MAKRASKATPDHLWERQTGEGSRAFAAFVHYRDGGPQRSQLKVSAKVGVNRNLICRWAVEHEWVRRAEAYDDFLDRERRAAELEALREMTKRHIDLGRALQSAAAVELRKLIEEVNASELGPDGRPVVGPDGKVKLTKRRLRPKEIREMAEAGAKLERLVRGEPTEITKGETTVRYTYADLVRKALERAGEQDGHG